METNNPQSPSELMHAQRREALNHVLDDLKSQIEEEMQNHKFSVSGREYPLTCSGDCMVASAQAAKRVAERILGEARKSNDYRREQAAAKIFELFDANELLVSRFAEFHEYFPEVADALEAYIPGLSVIAKSGRATWAMIREQQEKTA